MTKRAFLFVIFIFFSFTLFSDALDKKLFEALYSNDLAAISDVLKRGGNPNAINDVGSSLLMEACTASKAGIVELLIKNGADIEFRDKSGIDIFLISFTNSDESERFKIISLLLKNGVNLKSKYRKKYNAFHLAFEAFLLDLTQYDIVYNPDVDNALFNSCESAFIKTIKLLIRYERDINMPDSNGRSILMLCSDYAPLAAVELLLAAGAEPNQRDYNGNTAIFYATRNGRLDICKLLVKKDAFLEIVNSSDQTVIEHAKSEGQHNIYNYLRTISFE